MSAFVAAAESSEFRTAIGLEWIGRGGDGPLEQAVVLPDGMCEPDGSAALGVTAVLADSTLGTAAAAVKDGAEGIVTLGLHIDLTGTLPGRGSSMSMRSESVFVDGPHVWVRAHLMSGGAEIGLVTWRGLFTDFGRRHARLRRPAPPAPAGGDEAYERATGTMDGENGQGRGVDDVLRIEVHDGPDGEVRLVSRPGPHFASGWGTLHGGAVALLGQRAARHAGDGIGDSGGWLRPLSMDAEFFRPLPFPPPVAATGSVVHRGRSYMTTEGRVLLADGRLAAVVRVSGALNRPVPS